jgi:phosphatidylglycerol:prolipoprotein diacylglycerol transferase
MYPEICKIGPFTIYSYGLMLVVAFFVSVNLASRQAKKESVNPELVFNTAFIAFISGVAGARLLYLAHNLKHYLNNPLEMIMLQHGGLSWFGGLIAGSLAAAAYLKRKNLAVYKFLDLIVPFLALAQAIGRIGCLLNGCCFGKTVIPIQAYSSLLLIIIFMILRFFQERPHKEGAIFFAYLLLYSIKRFFVEFWRLDNEIIFLNLTLFQVISVMLFIFAFLKLILLLKPRK